MLGRGLVVYTSNGRWHECWVGQLKIKWILNSVNSPTDGSIDLEMPLVDGMRKIPAC
jgi:hypothetical protein